MGEELSLTSGSPESLDPVKGTIKSHLIPDRARLGGLELNLIHLSLRRSVKCPGPKRNWPLPGPVGVTSPWPVEWGVCRDFGNAYFLGRRAGTPYLYLPAIGTPRPERSGTRSGSGCGPGPWAAQREITEGWRSSTPRGGGRDLISR